MNLFGSLNNVNDDDVYDENQSDCLHINKKIKDFFVKKDDKIYSTTKFICTNCGKVTSSVVNELEINNKTLKKYISVVKSKKKKLKK